MTEEEELKAKIRQLQNRVQDHKAAARDSRSYKPYPQPQPRSPGSFRNRSLVVNSPGNGNQTEGVVKRGGATVQWLSRQQNMAKLEGLKRHEEQLHEIEKERILQHVQVPNFPISSWPNPGNSESIASTPKVINVQGSTFHVTRGGNKLLRISDEPGLAMATPKEITVHGVPFKRSKHGNLIRTKAITQGSVKKTHQCQVHGTLNNLISSNRLSYTKAKSQLCRRYTSTGRCPRGAHCPGIHDIHKLAICPSVLRRSQCTAGDACDLSHTLAPETTPTCTHYLLGRCTKDQCLYSHASIDPSSAICRDFAFLGYCQQGKSCEQRHLRECPDYTNDGRCRNRNCPLPHVDRASQMRKRLANKTGDAMDVDDLSGEEELYDGIDSEDVDSSDLDEPPEQVFGADNGEITEKDFIGFTS